MRTLIWEAPVVSTQGSVSKGGGKKLFALQLDHLTAMREKTLTLR